MPGHAGHDPEDEYQRDQGAGHRPPDPAPSVSLLALSRPAAHTLSKLAHPDPPDRPRPTPRLDPSTPMAPDRGEAS